MTIGAAQLFCIIQAPGKSAARGARSAIGSLMGSVGKKRGQLPLLIFRRTFSGGMRKLAAAFRKAS